MTLTWHRRLFLAESVLLTLPCFLVVCFFVPLGFIAGFASASSSIMACLEILVISATGIVGATALVYLSRLYLSCGLEVLQKSDRRAWITAAMGTVLALSAVLARAIFPYTTTNRSSGHAAILAFALIGAPLLIPFFHLLYLRVLRLIAEENP